MAREAFSFAPFIALACGVVAGLGVLQSLKRALAIFLAVWLIQVAGWTALFMWEPRDPHGDWNQELWASFLISLLVVTPYTVLGAVPSGAVVGLLRRRRRNGARL
jgi:hypothetical protein